MAAKTIALDQEAYRLLKSKKGPEETFSDVVKRLARPYRGIADLAGSLADLPAKDWEDIADNRRRLRQAELSRAQKHRSASGDP